MANKDRRHWDERFPVAHFEFDQGIWASGESAEVQKESDSKICGEIFAIEVIINATSNVITFTVTLDSANGAELCSIATIAKGQTTMLYAESGKGDADFNPIPIFGPLTVGMLPNGDPGASGATCDVIIYMR